MALQWPLMEVGVRCRTIFPFSVFLFPVAQTKKRKIDNNRNSISFSIVKAAKF